MIALITNHSEYEYILCIKYNSFIIGWLQMCYPYFIFHLFSCFSWAAHAFKEKSKDEGIERPRLVVIK